MPEVSPKVVLLRYTREPEELVAMGAKLCYSSSDISDLMKGIERKDQQAFVDKLMEYGHFSPVEHASFTFAVEGVSRSLLAQITRHRIASFSVKSQRYVSEGKEDGSTFNFVIPPSIRSLGDEAVAEYKEQMEQIQAWYNGWLEKLGGSGERANQDARFVLPNAAETKFIMTMNARELLHFFRLRCCNRAQWEIRTLARMMLKAVKEVSPGIFRNAGPGCLEGRCPEGRMSCGRMQEVRREYENLSREEE
ncbi:MAG: FAD-dependent thymidylate synthase [Clostridia bacterium]|jgi:thymidylate synthase (FAD)